jgi:diguanylate cyclase (GGDEF)-like protein
MNLAFSRGLRWRVVALVLVAAAPAVGVTVYSGFELRRHATHEARMEALSVARLAAERHEQLIAGTRRLLITLARTPEITGGNWARCNDFLGRFLQQAQEYANFGVAGLDGDVVCSALPLKGRVNLSDRTYFRHALETRDFAAGDYQVGRITGVPSLNLGYPVLGPDDQVAGVIFAALPLTWLNAVMADSLRIEKGSTLSVIGPDGIVLGRHPNSPDWVGKPFPVDAVLKAITTRGGEDTIESIGPDGPPQLFAYTAVKGFAASSPIHVVAGIPLQVAYRASERLWLAQLAILSGVIAAILAAAWWAGDGLVVRPIGRLAAATKRLAAGDFGTRAVVPAMSGEIADLAGAFNSMAETLGKREDEARHYLAHIERLNRVYAVLSGINGTILRIRDVDGLFARACRVAVEAGKFRLAWVGRIDEADEAVVPVASAGPASGCLDGLTFSTREDKIETCGVVGHCIQQSQWAVCNDIESDPRMAPWREVARANGLASCGAFPLRVEGKLFGVLVLHASEKDFFDETEVRLLNEVAADVSLGLEYIGKEHQLRRFAYFDGLTGLANRRLFEDRLEETLERARRAGADVAVAVMNLVGFRRINETFGRAAGDAVLVGVASYLSGAIGRDDMVARLEDDEFGLILAGRRSPEEGADAAKRILAGFPKTIAVGGDDVPVTVRMGVAFYPLDGEAAQTLAKNALLAQRVPAGEQGNSFRFFVPDIEAQAQERRRIERELRTAAERDELHLVYQPIIDIKRRSVVGVEALLRWRNWNLGDVSPAKFIPVAEQTGLIVPLGEWVLKTACRQARDWRERGLPHVKIGVNVAVRQLHHADFAERMRQIIESAGVHDIAGALAIEVTETELMESVDNSAKMLSELRAMGVSVAVDDFGTGYSSLGYLKSLPVDTLKIDYTFIKDIVSNPDDVVMVRTIVALAHGLNLRVVAEGVETPEQLELLGQLGCDAAQGFLFARPSEPAEVERLLTGPLRIPTGVETAATQPVPARRASSA